MQTTTPMTELPPQGDAEVFGERVRDARVIQRRKGQDVAAQLDVTPEKLSRWERQASTVLSRSDLLNLSTALDFPPTYFTRAPVTSVQRESLLFRAKKSLMSRGEEDEMVAWARLVGDVIHRSEATVDLARLSLPDLSDDVTPEDGAQVTRDALGVGTAEPIPHLMRKLEYAGVLLVALDFEAELHAKAHDALSTWVGHKDPATDHFGPRVRLVGADPNVGRA